MGARRGLLGALGCAFLVLCTLQGTAPATGVGDAPRSEHGAPRYDDLAPAVPGVDSFVLRGRWPTTSLGYFFANDTPDIAGTAAERQGLREAMAIWARVTPLRFTETTSAASAHIVIRFASGDHGDGLPFDSSEGVLAHAFYPPPTSSTAIAGDMHFDEAETWTVGRGPSTGQPIDLVTVAAHELGHTLGLAHSGDPDAMMYAFYGGSRRFLGSDDIAGIRAQYGATPGRYGWVSNSSATASSTPPAGTSYNSTGGSNTIIRTGVGSYQVRFAGLGGANDGNVQVSASGAGRRCKVASWGPSASTLLVNVRCFSLAGAPLDSNFVTQFSLLGPRAPAQGAYVWANLPTTASYTPSAAYSHNSTGATNTISRTGVGSYRVSLPGFTVAGGNVHVTAHGSTSHHCKVASWVTTLVNVRCFTSAGTQADTAFTLRYTRGHVANGGGHGAYTLANNATSGLYIPSAATQWHSKDGSVTAGRLGTGTYRVTFRDQVATNRTSTMVTAYGSTPHSCSIVSWLPSGTSTVARVQCNLPTGVLSDSLFTISYLTNRL